jgi:hypothetical protein
MTLATSGFLWLLPAAAAAAAVAALAITPEGAEGARVRPPGRLIAAFGILLPALALLSALQLDNALGLDTDDAPITFRYAENLASGRGFVYNPGERVLGTSAPLYTIALAGLRVAGLPVETSAMAIGVLAAAAVMALLVRFGALVAGPGGGLLAAALAATEAPFLVYATQGMETPAYTAIVLWALISHASGRERSASVLSALCVVMRLDGVIVPVAILASMLLQRRLPSRAAILLFLIVTAPWFLFSAVYFGHLAPQSLLAKIVHTKHAGRLWMLRGLFLEGNLLLVPFGILGAMRCCSGAEGARRAVVPIWLALYAAAFTIVPIDAYPWYRIPPVPVLALLSAAGIGWASSAWLASWTRSRKRIALVVLLLAIAPWGVARYRVYRDSLAQYAEQLRVWETPRVASAEWLRDHAPAHSSVCTSAIGHIGWITGLRVLDMSGLVSPGLLRGFDLDRVRPDFIVGHDGDPRPGEVFRVEHPEYTLVKSLAVEREVVYRIYARNDIALR